MGRILKAIIGFAQIPAIVLVFALGTAPAQAATLCTLIIEAQSGATLHESGHCDQRVTPASTFKIPLAVMGFDSGFLIDAQHPSLPFVEGYPDWISTWRSDTDPAKWMQESVVWYSQQIAKTLGPDRFAAYGNAFGYGNADFTGDTGLNNGLQRSWISSSLLISPREQAAFIMRLLDRSLPVKAQAIDSTVTILARHAAGDGWMWTGKTGSAYPRRADSSFDRGRGWGWYVGWADRNDVRLIVIRLHQADGPGQPGGGIHVRDTLIAEWAALASTL